MEVVELNLLSRILNFLLRKCGLDVSYPIPSKSVGDFAYAQDWNDLIPA
jgi:hypothetical protein